MKVVIQNLQKQPGLATDLVRERQPDVLLAQEINLPSEDECDFSAHYTSRMGYGTAIYRKEGYALANVRRVESPRAEFGGFIRKKTTVATLTMESFAANVELISFHGYNGQPFKNISGLVEHVEAVVAVVDPTLPAVFAGDFNTWTEDHLRGASEILEGAGFQRVFSWPYPGRDMPLDHAFVRGLRLVNAESYECASDHRGAVLEVLGAT